MIGILIQHRGIDTGRVEVLLVGATPIRYIELYHGEGVFLLEE